MFPLTQTVADQVCLTYMGQTAIRLHSFVIKALLVTQRRVVRQSHEPP